jgi:hypothetical protein
MHIRINCYTHGIAGCQLNVDCSDMADKESLGTRAPTFDLYPKTGVSR